MERQRLQIDHCNLDREIERAMAQRWPDPLTLQRLKKQKLAIKDRLHQIAQQPRETVNAA